MTLYKTWKEYLKFKRLEKGYTFSEVASKLNVTQEFYKKVELGMVQPSRSLFQRLVKLLGLDIITSIVLIKQDMTSIKLVETEKASQIGSLVRRTKDEIPVK